jgi:hypothetical protein
MHLRKLLLALAASATAASAQTVADWRTAALTAGSWTYRETTTGSEAVFTDARVIRRLVVKCSRVSRRVSLSVASPTPAAGLAIATTETERSLPAVFDAQGFQIVAELSAQDPLLDAIAFSRGRFAITAAGGAPLVVPAWPEIARSIEDCRL